MRRVVAAGLGGVAFALVLIAGAAAQGGGGGCAGPLTPIVPVALTPEIIGRPDGFTAPGEVGSCRVPDYTDGCTDVSCLISDNVVVMSAAALPIFTDTITGTGGGGGSVDAWFTEPDWSYGSSGVEGFCETQGRYTSYCQATASTSGWAILRANINITFDRTLTIA